MTINLRTKEEYDPRPADYCTKIAGTELAEPGTPCPLWLEFLDTVMAGDQGLVNYLQRVCGYCMTGDISEHALFFLHGTGANGKSVFISTLRGIFGDYHVTAPLDTFVLSHTSQHPTDLAGLFGARLVTAAETSEGRTWDESKIKAITGGDEIAARFMRQDFFRFTPQFKLMIAGNHKPRFRTIDEAIRRRIHLIPFSVTIPADKRDKALPKKLEAEWPAILRWMVEGCYEWQQRGLDPPAAVLAATEDYLEAEDALKTWIDEKCELKPSLQDTASSLFGSWKAWAEIAGEFVGSQKAFGQKLEGKGFKRRKSNGIIVYEGIQVV